MSLDLRKQMGDAGMTAQSRLGDLIRSYRIYYYHLYEQMNARHLFATWECLQNTKTALKKAQIEVKLLQYQNKQLIERLGRLEKGD